MSTTSSKQRTSHLHTTSAEKESNTGEEEDGDEERLDIEVEDNDDELEEGTDTTWSRLIACIQGVNFKKLSISTAKLLNPFCTV